MSWAGRRRTLYLSGTIAALIIIVGVPLFFVLHNAPSCFDGLRNGDELGIDCGGACNQLCNFQVADPAVLWSRSFEVTPGNYNAVAYVDNPNPGAAALDVTYRFQLFDESSLLIVERLGTAFLLPGRITPIFETDLQTDNRIPTRTFFEITKEPDWFKVKDRAHILSVRDRALTAADTAPRIDATLENTSVEEVQDIDIVSVIFGSDGNAIAASKTFIELFEGKTTRDIVFTWPTPFAKRIEACTAPADVALLLDLSGSMNDGGGDPPQPLAGAKQAAATFVERLTPSDKVSLITFATESSLVEALTAGHTRVRDAILALAIEPAEERGFTNIGDAIADAHTQFLSTAHNPEAQKSIILLTDGRANAPAVPGGEEHALAQAGIAKGGNTTLYSIGLGDNISQQFLEDLAGSSERVFLAASSDELDAIYKEISTTLCERGAAIIDIIPKSLDLFVPGT